MYIRPSSSEDFIRYGHLITFPGVWWYRRPVGQEQEQTKSAISDYVARANHVIDFDNPKSLGPEHNKKAREIKEAVEIRKRGEKTLNREPRLRPTFKDW